MFSDHMKKPSRFPQAGLLMAAGGLVIVCQLAAMAMVADRQVQRAGVRDLQRVAQQVAMNDCIQRSTGPARHGCIRQSQLEAGMGSDLEAAPDSAVSEPATASLGSKQTFAAKNVAIADERVTAGNPALVRVGASVPR